MSEHIDATRVALYTAGAVAYAVSGYVKKVTRDDAVDFDVTKFGKTVAIGLVAGLVMAFGGDEFSQETYIAATAVAIPVVDQLTNALLGSRSPSGTQRRPRKDR